VMLSTCGDDSASGLTEAVSTASALRQVRTQGCGTSLYTLGGQSQCSYITAWELYPDFALPISTTLQIYVSEALHFNFSASPHVMEHETKNAGKAPYRIIVQVYQTHGMGYSIIVVSCADVLAADIRCSGPVRRTVFRCGSASCPLYSTRPQGFRELRQGTPPAVLRPDFRSSNESNGGVMFPPRTVASSLDLLCSFRPLIFQNNFILPDKLVPSSLPHFILFQDVS
jgi:hypothetical protein